jgi:hypothetical protein
MGVTTADPIDDIVADMNIYINKSDGMLQVNPLLPLHVVYQHEHNSGTIGNLWREHHKQFATFISKQSPKSVLEIGGAHGILSTKYMHFNPSIQWTIIEPNPTPVAECNATIIKGFFNEDFVCPIRVDTIVHSHVFEHMYDPVAFVQLLSTFLEIGQKLIFSVPNMKAMLINKYLNFINFEHTFYLSDDYIEFLLASYGFRLEKKEYFLDDNSIFYVAVRDVITEHSSRPTLYNKNKILFDEYITHYYRLVNDINKQLANYSGTVFQFGAHIITQYLINFGLDTSKISAILDNDPDKQGRRLYGTILYVQSPKILIGLDRPVVLLQNSSLSNEIKQDILDNINSTTIFL